MANINSLTLGNTALPVANSLASLNDVSNSNAAAGNILTFDGTTWTNGTLTGNNGVSVSRNGVNYTLAGDATWTKQQAIAAPLTDLDTSLTGNITASDTVLSAMGKLSGATYAVTDFADANVGGSLSFYFLGSVVIVKGNLTFKSGYTGGSVSYSIPRSIVWLAWVSAFSRSTGRPIGEVQGMFLVGSNAMTIQLSSAIPRDGVQFIFTSVAIAQ